MGYDVNTKTLEIQFNDSSVYQYYQVPQETYVSLMKAESHGTYFYAMIRNAFQYRKVGYEPLQGYRKTVSNKFNDDSDYDYGDEGYDPRDLKYDLGLYFMSDDEFDIWLEDAGNDRD